MKYISIFLVLFILTGCTNQVATKQPNPIANKNASSKSESTPIPNQANITFQFDGEAKNFTTNVTASEMKGSTYTVLMAFGSEGNFFQVSIPKRQVGSYSRADEGIGLHYGVNTNLSYEPNISNGDDQVTINITRYDQQKIEGTFSGTLTNVTTSGFGDKHATITNGKFSVTDIKPL